MESTNYAIIEGHKYEWPGGALTPRTVAQEGQVPMQNHDTPTHKSIPENRRPYWSEEHQCYLVPLTRGKVAMVDAESLPKVSPYLWQASKWRHSWYATRQDRTGEKERTVPMHREIMGNPEGLVVDHISGDGLDNRRDNLRACTHSENLRNRRRTQSNNTSGYTGVRRSGGKWSAAVAHHGEITRVGGFDTPDEAAIARDIIAIEIHGEFAHLNFPEFRALLDMC